MSKITIDDPITQGIKQYLGKTHSPAYLTMVFPELTQSEANSLAEDIEDIARERYNVLVFVDEAIIEKEG